MVTDAAFVVTDAAFVCPPAYGAAPPPSADGAAAEEPKKEVELVGRLDETTGKRMLTPLEAVQPSLIGRYVEVLWPDDGTWWKAKVTHLVPGTGMATLFY